MAKDSFYSGFNKPAFKLTITGEETLKYQAPIVSNPDKKVIYGGFDRPTFKNTTLELETALQEYKDSLNKDYDTQLRAVNKLRTLNIINEQQRKDLQTAIIYNDRVAKSQTSGGEEVFKIAGTKELGYKPGKLRSLALQQELSKIPVIKTLFKPFITPQSELEATINQNKQLIGLTPSQQKYIDDLGEKVRKSGYKQGVDEYNLALQDAEKLAKNNMQTTTFFTNPSIFINTYNKKSSLEQRSVLKDLENTVRDYSNSSEKDLKELADKSKVLLTYLTADKANVEEYNKALGLQDQRIPEVKTQRDAITFGLDFGRAAVEKMKDFGKVLSSTMYENTMSVYNKLGINPKRRDMWSTNYDAYKSGQIDKRTFERNTARIEDWFNRTLQYDTEKERWLRSIGWGAFGASFFLPGAGFLKGAPFIFKDFLIDFVGNGALNLLSTFTDYTEENPPKLSDYASNFVIGSVMSSLPYIYTGIKTGVVRAQIADMPGGADFASKLENAADQQAASQAIIDTFAKVEDPELASAALNAIRDGMTVEDTARLKTALANAAQDTADLNAKLADEVTLEGLDNVTTAADNIPTVTTTVDTTPTVAAVETTPSATLSENLVARQNIFVEDTGTKVGNAREFRIVDTNGKNLGTIKANTIQAASARLQQIKASPVRYSKQFPGVFEQPKQTAVKAARVTKEKAPAPTTKPTAVRRPAFMPEGYVVLEKSRTQPNGKITTEFILRDAGGREIRRLTTSEIRRYREYTKARIEAFRASQATGKAQTQLEAARAEARAAQEQARIDAGLQPSVVRGREKAETIIEASGMGKQKPTKPPTITSFGKKVELSEKNGWKAVKTKDGGTIYTKTTTTGSNKKGDRGPVTMWYDARGTKLTQAQAKAMIEGKMKAPRPTEVAEDNLRERPTIKNGKPVIQTIDSEGNVVKTTEVAAEMGKQKPTIIKEKGVVKVEVPAKAKVPAKPTKPAPVPTTPPTPGLKEAITRGSERTVLQDIESGYRTTFPDSMATYGTLEGKIKETLIPQYEKDIINNLDHVIDVITGRKMPENNVQQELYTVLLQTYLQKSGDAKLWRKVNNAVNLAGSYAHRKVSEAAQKLSAISLVADKYDINGIINRIQKQRIDEKKALFQARGTSYEKVIAKEREAIQNFIPEITPEDNLKLIRSYTEKKFGPLLKAFAEGKINLKEFTKMTPDRRLSTLVDILKDDKLALRYAADFEKKLLLKNQKLGLLNWLKSDIKMDPLIKKDLVTQIMELENVLDPANAGKFDNFIDTKLGIRLTGAQQEKLFELSGKVREAEDGLKKVYGDDLEVRLKRAANLVEGKVFKKGTRLNWERTPEDYAYGEALANTMIYLRDVQTKGWLQSMKEAKELSGLRVGYKALKDMNDLMRALGSAIDNSFLLRQAMQVAKTNPTAWAKGAGEAYKSIARTIDNPKLAEKTFMTYILSDPWAEKASRNGLAILTKDDIFSTALSPSDIPVLGRAYKASELAYDTAAQVMRLELYKKFYTQDMLALEKLNKKQIAKRAADSNYAKIDTPPEYAKNLATYINALTGRGDLGKLEPIAQTLNLWSYSARFLASQLQKIFVHPAGGTIGGITYKAENGKIIWNPVHKRASANLMKIIVTTAGLMGIANALKPGSAELDPRSADFGKIKVKNTRFDITGGMGQFVVLAARTLPAFAYPFTGKLPATKNSNTGLVTELNSQEYGAKTSFDVMLEFFQNKTSPLMGQFITQMKGVDINRMEPTLGSNIEKLIQPMFVGNVRELVADKPSSVMQKAISAFLDFNGLAANTYAGAGQGRKGASWEISNAQDIIAFKQKVGEAEFKKAAKEADDKYNALVLELLEDPDYQRADDKTKGEVIRLAKAKIEKDIFNKYRFKYTPQKRSKTERQLIENLINRNL